VCGRCTPGTRLHLSEIKCPGARQNVQGVAAPRLFSALGLLSRQAIYDAKQRTELDMARREQEMKQLQGARPPARPLVTPPVSAARRRAACNLSHCLPLQELRALRRLAVMGLSRVRGGRARSVQYPTSHQTGAVVSLHQTCAAV